MRHINHINNINNIWILSCLMILALLLAAGCTQVNAPEPKNTASLPDSTENEMTENVEVDIDTSTDDTDKDVTEDTESPKNIEPVPPIPGSSGIITLSRDTFLFTRDTSTMFRIAVQNPSAYTATNILPTVTCNGYVFSYANATAKNILPGSYEVFDYNVDVNRLIEPGFYQCKVKFNNRLDYLEKGFTIQVN
jgi:hypothetical protein